MELDNLSVVRNSDEATFWRLTLLVKQCGQNSGHFCYIYENDTTHAIALSLSGSEFLHSLVQERMSHLYIFRRC